MCKTTKRKWVFFAVFAAGFLPMVFLASTAFAGELELQNPLGDIQSIPALANLIIKGLFGIIGTVALVIFMYGGFVWMTAQGQEKKIKQGWDTFTWGALGLILIFGSYIIVSFLLNILLEQTPGTGSTPATPSGAVQQGTGGSAKPAAGSSVPAKKPTPSPSKKNPKNCSEAGGICKDKNKLTCTGGQWLTGLCPGKAEVQCCVGGK
jgi:hypothetical protein